MSAVRLDRLASWSRRSFPDVLVRPGGGPYAWRRGARAPGTRRAHDGGRGRRSRMPRDADMAVACGDGFAPSRGSPIGWASELTNVKSPHPIPHQRPRTGRGQQGFEGMAEVLNPACQKRTRRHERGHPGTETAALENRQGASPRGFESHPLRSIGSRFRRTR